MSSYSVRARGLAALAMLMSLVACDHDDDSSNSPPPPCTSDCPPATPPPPPPPPPAPAPPQPAPTITSRIAAGVGYTIAVRADGRVLTWGNLMPGAATTPVAGSPSRLVEGVADVASVAATGAATGFSLALRGDGTVAGWGNNNFGALQQPLAIGSLVVTTSPVPLDALVSVSQVKACVEYSVALRSDGTVWMLPASASTSAVTARQINGLANVVRLGGSVRTLPSLANCEFVAIDQAGALKTVELTRGINADSFVTSETVRDVSGLPPIKQAHCGGTDANNRFCVALDANGRVWTMGGGGLLGDGSTGARTNWAMLSTPIDVASIEISGLTSLALTTAGELYCWGSQDMCLYGPGAVLAPSLVAGLPAVAEIATGPLVVMAAARDGSVWGWGFNIFGEVGSGGTAPVQQPTPVSGVNLN
jgi:alpha-tubulin suppressor-like RCC1 family protein